MNAKATKSLLSYYTVRGASPQMFDRFCGNVHDLGNRTRRIKTPHHEIKVVRFSLCRGHSEPSNWFKKYPIKYFNDILDKQNKVENPLTEMFKGQQQSFIRGKRIS